MSLVNDVDLFIKNTQRDVFIEAEAKPDRMNKFINEYNSKYSPRVNTLTDGIIYLKEDANKWGLELRVYLYTKAGIPANVNVTHNDQYRGNYSYRINDVNLIEQLFNLGYRIGIN